MIRILVADDHPIVRAGLVALLEAEDDVEVVGTATTGGMSATMRSRPPFTNA